MKSTVYTYPVDKNIYSNLTPEKLFKCTDAVYQRG